MVFAKQVCSYLIELITFTCTVLPSKKTYEITKEKKDVISNWSHLNLCFHIFGFHLCDSCGCWFVVVAVAFVVAGAAAVVVVPVVAAVGKNVQQ